MRDGFYDDLKNLSEFTLAELNCELIMQTSLTIANVKQVPGSMFGQLRRPTRSFCAALICGCWVILTLAVPIAHSHCFTQPTVTVDCLTANVPASTPFSDTSIDESTLRLSQAVSKIDAVGNGLSASYMRKQRAGCSCLVSAGGSSALNQSLLTLGIALRL